MKAKGDKAYAAYLDAKCLPTIPSETGEHRYTPEAIEGMQRAILAALRSDAPVDDEIRMDLAYAFECICAGLPSELLQPMKRYGGRDPVIAGHMQGAAIRYLRWVEDGRIEDRHPISTVAQAYDVTTRTVRNWSRAWQDSPTPGIYEEYGSDEVTRFMKATGGSYRRYVKKPESTVQSLRGQTTHKK